MKLRRAIFVLLVMVLLVAVVPAQAEEGRNLRLVVNRYADSPSEVVRLYAYDGDIKVKELRILGVLNQSNITHGETYIYAWLYDMHPYFGTMWIALLNDSGRIQAGIYRTYIPLILTRFDPGRNLSGYNVIVNKSDMAWLKWWAPKGTVVHTWLVPPP